jgi:hypothetical protein
VGIGAEYTMNMKRVDYPDIGVHHVPGVSSRSLREVKIRDCIAEFRHSSFGLGVATMRIAKSWVDSELMVASYDLDEHYC